MELRVRRGESDSRPRRARIRRHRPAPGEQPPGFRLSECSERFSTGVFAKQPDACPHAGVLRGGVNPDWNLPPEGGVREPRKPAPTLGAGAMALHEPRNGQAFG